MSLETEERTGLPPQYDPDWKTRPVRPLYWIASYPKSGNTWTRLFLLALLRENGNIPGEGADFEGLGTYFSGDGQGRIYETMTGRSLADAPARELAEARLAIHEYLARSQNGVPMLKTHSALGNYHGVLSHNMPISRGGVYIVRNPLDVCRSLGRHNATDVDAAIVQMNKVNAIIPQTKKGLPEMRGSWSQNVASWTHPATPKVLVMRYEDMVENPVAQFTKLVRHVGFPISDKVIAKAVDDASFANLKATEEEKGFGEKPEGAERFFNEGKSGGWRDNLSAEQVKSLVMHQAVQMERFGYLTEEVLGIAGVSAEDAKQNSQRHIREHVERLNREAAASA